MILYLEVKSQTKSLVTFDQRVAWLPSLSQAGYRWRFLLATLDAQLLMENFWQITFVKEKKKLRWSRPSQWVYPAFQVISWSSNTPFFRVNTYYLRNNKHLECLGYTTKAKLIKLLMLYHVFLREVKMQKTFYKLKTSILYTTYSSYWSMPAFQVLVFQALQAWCPYTKSFFEIHTCYHSYSGFAQCCNVSWTKMSFTGPE